MKRILAVLNLGNCLRPKCRDSIQAAAGRWEAEYVEITKPIIPGKHHFWQKALLHRVLPDNAHVLQLDTDVLVHAAAPSPFPLCPPERIGLTRVNPHFCHWVAGRNQAILFWAEKLHVPPVDVFTEYPNLGFLMYSTPHHRALLDRVYETGRLTKWSNKGMPEQTVLALLVHHEKHLHRWLPTIYNTCGLPMHINVSRKRNMTTFVYHFCGDSKWVLPAIDWRVPPDRFGRALEILKHLPADRNTSLRGAEVGVFQGILASRLLCHLPNLHLTLVDPWVAVGPKTRYHQSNDALSRRHQQTVDRDFEMAWRETEFAINRRRIIYQPSREAVKQVDDGSLDFVFIDADHGYAACKEDIRLWLPKLKPDGGLLSGHDYNNRGPGKKWGVNRAVNEFVAASGLKLVTGPDCTWFIHAGG